MLIAVRTLPGGGAKEQAGHGAASSLPRQILEVLSHGAAVAQIMELMKQRFEERSIRGERRTDFP